MSGLLQIAIMEGKVDLSQLAVDGSFSPAPGGGEKVDYGHKGKGVLLHLLIDKNGNAIAITTTDAKGDENQEVSRLLTQLPLKSLKGRVVVLKRTKVMMQAGYVSFC